MLIAVGARLRPGLRLGVSGVRGLRDASRRRYEARRGVRRHPRGARHGHRLRLDHAGLDHSALTAFRRRMARRRAWPLLALPWFLFARRRVLGGIGSIETSLAHTADQHDRHQREADGQTDPEAHHAPAGARSRATSRPAGRSPSGRSGCRSSACACRRCRGARRWPRPAGRRRAETRRRPTAGRRRWRSSPRRW